MKTLASLLVLSGMFLLGGCATTTNQTAALTDDNIDYQKVYLVDNWARRNNVEVHWVNYPQKTARIVQ